MNIIQLARIMADALTFGDLPESIRVVDEINRTLDEDDDVITSTSTGNDLVVIYDELSPAKQNKLAGLFADDYKLKEALASDIVLREVSLRKREQRNYQQTVKITLFVVILMLGYILFLAYDYHKIATKVMGINYQSNVIEVVTDLSDVLDMLPWADGDEDDVVVGKP